MAYIDGKTTYKRVKLFKTHKKSHKKNESLCTMPIVIVPNVYYDIDNPQHRGGGEAVTPRTTA